MNDSSAESPAAGEACEETSEDALQILKDHLAANAAESRRTARRTMDVLKEMGNSLASFSVLLNDVHQVSRQPPSAAIADTGPSAAASSSLIDLHDRVSRLHLAFAQSPGPRATWWPGGTAALSSWAQAWDTQKAAITILLEHLESTLAKAGIQRLDSVGFLFDPHCMMAVEATVDAAQPDHTVLAELRSGWRTAEGAILRAAQVKVARRPG